MALVGQPGLLQTILPGTDGVGRQIRQAVTAQQFLPLAPAFLAIDEDALAGGQQTPVLPLMLVTVASGAIRLTIGPSTLAPTST